ncbi:single-stranded-DNA-specific exonuclease RecJ [Clostridium tepidiprofundi DSM 19306]|uniref:Single-stranded-DNA-specific exonuclease RecJ n=1 Tax=Clostridium tepidiprofundi DSM 19306 TaxID=1121338 RepID=A0A151B4P6_9CLOT|nr:single-stranded-DNA-specific exonuclease RecJ [Clostridium tepidiprofundi]KYH34773.1 single-stranded-DNA-specific exonuclease RecJ [Clostridium tepidiprofundi DSM 19306]
MKSKWTLRTTRVNTKELSQKTGFSSVVTKILVNRGINSPEAIKRFMYGDIKDLYDPFLMKDMDKGTEIIKNAIISNKKIVIYGDYDADGVTSTSILFKALKRCGANVDYYIPDRQSEGYGMCSDRIMKLHEEGYDVILTCDNGISAIDEIKLAKSLGMTVIVTDHHELVFKEDDKGNEIFVMPEADAIINTKRKDCTYPFKMLCGAGIAYKFAIALYSKFKIDISETYEFIELAGIGTICDVVDLIDENRIIAKKSLEMLTKTKNLGLRTLKKVIGIEGKAIKSYNVGFQIGPCINATGRLETAALSVELLLCNDEKKAYELANTLFELNKKRQHLTNMNVEQVVENIENSEMKNHKVIVVYKSDIHESIAGIVAGKIREKFNVPCIILTDGKEMPKGSGRSIEKYNIFKELVKCKELLEKFGGHPMAAGLSIKEENIDKLRYALNKNCKLSDDDIIPKIRIDEVLPLENISYKLINELEMLEPFGKGNPSPILANKNVIVDNASLIGKEKNVVRFKCRIPNTNRIIDAVCFNGKDKFEEIFGEAYTKEQNNNNTTMLDIIFSPYINEYNGIKSIQLKVSDFRLSK